MAEVVNADVVEQILIRLDVKDLIRCKSVCKSWNSLITSPGFINRHLDRSYNNDRHNNEFRHRRVILDCCLSYKVVGSSNGLVCIISNFSGKVLVGNPSTRELRRLRSPPVWMLSHPASSLSFGFGYDSSGDDYKLVVAASKGENQTCVQVLSMKSNVWRVIGEVKYAVITEAGILCDGALHWIVRDENKKMVIVSYDLSKNKYEEILLPEDARYKEIASSSFLGIMNECLCVYGNRIEDMWLMKKYNGKQSWELLTCHHGRKYTNLQHLMGLPEDESYISDWGSCGEGDSDYPFLCSLSTPIYVQSLVSTHKRRAPLAV